MQIRSLFLTTIMLIVFPLLINAQATRGLADFPELVNAAIPGAPKLGKPMLVVGTAKPVVSEGFGLAGPAVWDWDKDGTKDLLIGEFGSGIEFGHNMGNFIRVYLNRGTESTPEFNDRFDYARPPFQYLADAKGTPYSVDQSCCIGFTPQFTDIDQDGYKDMITGQYQGEVSWFRGSEAGFMPGEILQQEGEIRGVDWVSMQNYWIFSSASFGDFTNDGLIDLITGGTSLRISKNVGTQQEPKFAHRELLEDIQGAPLSVHEYTSDEFKELKKYQDAFGTPIPPGGDNKISPYVVDWDNDGILDLLVTNSYISAGYSAVDFFKGIKINGEHRFHKGVPLFTSIDGSKFLPGSGPRIFITDWNSDGVNDLLIGASVVTMNGEFNSRLSWNWEHDEGILSAGKDPGNLHVSEDDLQRYKNYYRNKLPKEISMDDYMTIRHQGYIYVMLGSLTEAQANIDSQEDRVPVNTQRKVKSSQTNK